MSANKFRFYDVNIVRTVKALNQKDAVSLANGSRRVPGEMMAEVVEVERITADEAHNWAEQINS